MTDDERAAFKAEILSEVAAGMRQLGDDLAAGVTAALKEIGEGLAKEIREGEMGAVFDRLLSLELYVAMDALRPKPGDVLAAAHGTALAVERVRTSLLQRMPQSDVLRRLLEEDTHG